MKISSTDSLPKFLRDVLAAPPTAGAGVHGWLFRCKRRLKSAAGGARKVLHLPGKGDWIFRFSSSG